MAARVGRKCVPDTEKGSCTSVHTCAGSFTMLLKAALVTSAHARAHCQPWQWMESGKAWKVHCVKSYTCRHTHDSSTDLCLATAALPPAFTRWPYALDIENDRPESTTRVGDGQRNEHMTSIHPECPFYVHSKRNKQHRHKQVHWIGLQGQHTITLGERDNKASGSCCAHMALYAYTHTYQPSAKCGEHDHDSWPSCSVTAGTQNN